jgi:hypothetical protein
MDGEVGVAPEAFASEGVLQSTLDHEGVHVTQIENGQFHAYNDSPASLVNEVEAYRAGLATSMNYPGDTVLQGARGEWIQQYADALGGLEGTSYYKNVTANPPNYDLKEGDKCLVCRLK